MDFDINKTYKEAFKSKARYIILYGGAGSGKSVFTAQKFITRMLDSKGKERFLFVRKIHRTIRNSQYLEVKDPIQLSDISKLFTFRDSTIEIDCQNGNEIRCAGIDDPEKIKSYKGLTSIWIEEATELTEEDFIQLDLRLRGQCTGEYFQIVMSFNPINENHWLNKIKLDDCLKLHTTYKDNRFIDEQYKKRLESLAERNPDMYKIYTLGEWGTLENLIYKPFPTLKEYPESFDEIIYGLDFGFNNPTALIEIGIRDKEFYLTELIYQSGLTNTDLINRLENSKIDKNAPLYCDNAEPNRIEEIRAAGYNSKPANKSVKDGIDFLKSQTIFSKPENIELNKEVVSYSWKKDRNGIIFDEPVKFNDHLLDAGRYAIYTHFKNVSQPGIFWV